MMFPIEQLDFAQNFSQRLRKTFRHRIRVGAEVGMMNETFATDLELASQLAHVGFHGFALRVHKRIEAENKID
jgi:hypothetical protein